MNTLDVLKCLEKIGKKSFEFGVFPCNRLPKNIKKPALIVANTDLDIDPGTHWVAFYIPKYGSAEYFDSYGLKPSNKYFIEFLKTQSKVYKYNKLRLQSDFTKVCGNYCCVFLYFKSINLPTQQILKMFEKDKYHINDRRVLRLFSSIYKKKKQIGGGNKPVCIQTCKPVKYKSSKL